MQAAALPRDHRDVESTYPTIERWATLAVLVGALATTGCAEQSGTTRALPYVAHWQNHDRLLVIEHGTTTLHVVDLQSGHQDAFTLPGDVDRFKDGARRLLMDRDGETLWVLGNGRLHSYGMTLDDEGRTRFAARPAFRLPGWQGNDGFCTQHLAQDALGRLYVTHHARATLAIVEPRTRQVRYQSLVPAPTRSAMSAGPLAILDGQRDALMLDPVTRALMHVDLRTGQAHHVSLINANERILFDDVCDMALMNAPRRNGGATALLVGGRGRALLRVTLSPDLRFASAESLAAPVRLRSGVMAGGKLRAAQRVEAAEHTRWQAVEIPMP